jgi:hypothetical protein
MIDGELEESRQELMSARARGDDQAEAELMAQWQGRLRRLLATDPDIASALRDVVYELEESASRLNIRTERIKMNAKATGHGRVYQQGQGAQHNR